MAYCTACGHLISNDAPFCGSCGTSQGMQVKPLSHPNTTAKQPSGAPEHAAEALGVSPEKNMKRNVIGFLAIPAVLLLLAFAMYQYSPTPLVTPTPTAAPAPAPAKPAAPAVAPAQATPTEPPAQAEPLPAPTPTACYTDYVYLCGNELKAPPGMVQLSERFHALNWLHGDSTLGFSTLKADAFHAQWDRLGIHMEQSQGQVRARLTENGFGHWECTAGRRGYDWETTCDSQNDSYGVEVRFIITRFYQDPNTGESFSRHLDRLWAASFIDLKDSRYQVLYVATKRGEW